MGPGTMVLCQEQVTEMTIQDHTGNRVIVALPPEPDVTEGLETIIAMVRQHADRDVVIDFTNVGVVTSAGLSRLLQLRKTMHDNGHSLVLRNVAPITHGIFSTVGFDELFEFCDRVEAVAGQQETGFAD